MAPKLPGILIRLAAVGLALALPKPLQTDDVPAGSRIDPVPEWRLSLYPDAHPFAFTIVSDADSSYSRRLAPLFEEFDSDRLKITVTAFVFWADWAKKGKIWSDWAAPAGSERAFFAPVAVPLEDAAERAFYLGLAARGHEVGMHTPSDNSDTTEDLARAFVRFEEIFGHPPSVYVEHSGQSNKETLENEGSDPRSRYYSLGILNRYRPWVWVDGSMALPRRSNPRYFDLAAVKGPPFTDDAVRHYGIPKVFMRTGKWKSAEGDGFLEWYSKANIDALEAHRGLAIVYTHLNEKWLDRKTRKMRDPLRARLGYLASKDGWFVPAGTILDRIALMKKVVLRREDLRVIVENRNTSAVASVSVISPKGRSLCNETGVFRPRATGDILLGELQAGETRRFGICR